MLDVNVDFCFPSSGGVGHVVFSLFTKPSSIWQPLSPDSVHPVSIHLHWPRAQCERIKSRFSCRLSGEKAASDFKIRYYNAFQIRVIDQDHSRSSTSHDSTSWIVLPYNLCLVLGKLANVVSSFVFPDCFPFDMARLSWRLGDKHLKHLMRFS